MALQASALGELHGALGRLGYLCAEGGKAMFVAPNDLSMLECTTSTPSADVELLIDALSSIP